jgi:hypothetical protein
MLHGLAVSVDLLSIIKIKSTLRVFVDDFGVLLDEQAEVVDVLV